VAPTPEACKQLLKVNLPGEFPIGDHLAHIPHKAPEKLLGSIETGVALAAISTTGEDLEINMRMPAIKRELEKLAAKGAGGDMEYQGAKFMFVDCKWLFYAELRVDS